MQLKLSRAKLNVKKMKTEEINYSYYLGPNYKLSYEPPKGAVPTYVAPHCSALDGPALVNATKGKVSFVAGDFIRKWPMFGFMNEALKSIFVPRGGTPEALQNTLDMIG